MSAANRHANVLIFPAGMNFVNSAFRCPDNPKNHTHVREDRGFSIGVSKEERLLAVHPTFHSAIPWQDEPHSAANERATLGRSLHHQVRAVPREDKYKVIGFGLKYTRGRAGHDQQVTITQLCVHHHILIYHYCKVTMPCEFLPGL